MKLYGKIRQMKNNIYLLIFLLVFLCGCASAPRYTTGQTHLSTKSKSHKTSKKKISKKNNVKQLKKMKKSLNLSGFALEFNAGEIIQPDKVKESLTLFCKEVMPELR